ncbi:MAG: AraC family transcriptional regulator [Faecalimonas sp.]|nr:AraC family transcriptional regulator [Faecalimonas sp.]
MPKYQYTNCRDFYLIHFVRSGRGRLQIDGHTYTLTANDAFLIRPNQLAVYTADEITPWEYYYFAFAGDMVANLIERTHFQNQNIFCTLPDSTLYERIIEAASNIYNSDNAPDICALEHLFGFLELLAAPSSIPEIPTASKAPSPSEKLFSSVQEYMQLNYFRPIQIADICKSTNISRSYLFRIFKKYANTNVEDYLISLRIQHAKRLLTATDFSVATIANLVGYPNITSFYRVFKRIEKKTPNEWRKLRKDFISKNKNGSISEHL